MPVNEYLKRSTNAAGDLYAAIAAVATKKDGGVATLDSAVAGEFVSEIKHRHVDGVNALTLQAEALFDEAGASAGLIAAAVFDGAQEFTARHGYEPSADVIEQAVHSAYTHTAEARRKHRVFDSVADSNHSANLSLQPNRAIVAILSTISEAIPFAHYLPADIGSNEAKLAIMSHLAGNTYGGYAQNAMLDGAESGERYIGTSRTHKCAVNGTTGAITGKLTAVQTDSETCNAASAELPLVRGRSKVYVNGLLAASETSTSGSGTSAVSGAISFGGTSYVIGGTINTDTGAIALTSTPALADTVPVHVIGYVDYERNDAAALLVPRIISSVETFSIFAHAWKCNTRQSIDARMQMANELGLDPYAESVLAIQMQFANERHYDVLRMLKRVAVNNTATFNYDATTKLAQRSRADAWRDFSATLGAVSQQMAVDTMNHGVTHLYGGQKFCADVKGLPNDIFQPSGISDRPGIYRVGRLFGMYDVYFSPKSMTETSDATQILAIGRATDVTRNPIVLGDAVPPTVNPLAMGDDLKTGAGFYGRNFCEINPHAASAKGAALIDVTDLF